MLLTEPKYLAESDRHFRKRFTSKREIIEYRHAIEPLVIPLQKLVSETFKQTPEALKPFFRDTLDNLLRACEHLRHGFLFNGTPGRLGPHTGSTK